MMKKIGTVLILLAGPFGAMADEFVDLKDSLVAINKETSEIRGEIEDLERVSAERARNIKILKAKVQAATRHMERQQDELEKVRAQAATVQKAEAGIAAQAAAAEAQLAAVTKELDKVKADYAKEAAKHKAKMAKIEADKKEELKRKAELTERVTNFEAHLRKDSVTRETAQQEVDNIYKGNERLYEKLKTPAGQ